MPSFVCRGSSNAPEHNKSTPFHHKNVTNTYQYSIIYLNRYTLLVCVNVPSGACNYTNTRIIPIPYQRLPLHAGLHQTCCRSFVVNINVARRPVTTRAQTYPHLQPVGALEVKRGRGNREAPPRGLVAKPGRLECHPQPVRPMTGRKFVAYPSCVQVETYQYVV